MSLIVPGNQCVSIKLPLRLFPFNSVSLGKYNALEAFAYILYGWMVVYTLISLYVILPNFFIILTLTQPGHHSIDELLPTDVGIAVCFITYQSFKKSFPFFPSFHQLHVYVYLHNLSQIDVKRLLEW